MICNVHEVTYDITTTSHIQLFHITLISNICIYRCHIEEKPADEIWFEFPLHVINSKVIYWHTNLYVTSCVMTYIIEQISHLSVFCDFFYCNMYLQCTTMAALEMQKRTII